MGRVSRDARLLFVQLWTICDDSGRTRGNSRILASLLYPYDDDAGSLIDGWLSELDREGCIARYSVDGATYLEVKNWRDHQRIDKPTPSKLPEFVESSRILANPPEKVAKPPSGIGKDWKGVEGKGKGSTTAAARPCLDRVKAIYPKRSGSQPWGRAEKAIAARLREGHAESDLIAGVERYAQYVQEIGIERTAYVLQAATFFGPEKQFLETWEPPLTRAEQQQNANVQAGREWLEESNNAPF